MKPVILVQTTIDISYIFDKFWQMFDIPYLFIYLCIHLLFIYSRPSLCRTRLSRITAYLEVKLWSLF